MRVYIEIDEHHFSFLRELARECYRPPRHHAAWLLADAIERAVSQRAKEQECAKGADAQEHEYASAP